MAAWATTGSGPYKASTPALQAQILAPPEGVDLVAYGRLHPARQRAALERSGGGGGGKPAGLRARRRALPYCSLTFGCTFFQEGIEYEASNLGDSVVGGDRGAGSGAGSGEGRLQALQGRVRERARCASCASPTARARSPSCTSIPTPSAYFLTDGQSQVPPARRQRSQDHSGEGGHHACGPRPASTCPRTPATKPFELILVELKPKAPAK